MKNKRLALKAEIKKIANSIEKREKTDKEIFVKIMIKTYKKYLTEKI